MVLFKRIELIQKNSSGTLVYKIKIELSVSLGVLICLNCVSIETLDLDIVKKFVSTLKKILTFSKSLSQQLRNLDLDWSRMLRPPSLP